MPFFPLADMGWTLLLLLLVITLVASLARGFSGFGAALIFVPLVSALLGPKLAAPLLLVTDSLMSLPLLPPALRIADRREVLIMAGGAILGVPAGTWLLTTSDPQTIRWAIAALAGSMLGLLASGWRYRGRPTTPLTILVGLVSGLCSGTAQIGGPPVVAYWLGGQTSAQNVRASIVVFFALTSVLSIAAYAFGNMLPLQILALCALIAPVYGLGLWLGSRLFGRASETTFRRICLTMIAFATLISMPALDGLLRTG